MRSDRRLSPSVHTVDIWLMSPDKGRPWINQGRTLLSQAEAARARAFLQREARERYELGRILLRSALSKYANIAPQAWDFATSSYGKPFISTPASGSHLRFNVSHTDGLIACAVSERIEVGLDVEDGQRELDLTTLAPHVFTPPEMASFTGLTPRDKQAYFFKIWTLKEAYVKALGVGIRLPFNTFSFELNDANANLRVSGVDRARTQWQFISLALSPNHTGALVVATRSVVSVRMFWTSTSSSVGAGLQIH